MRGPGAIDVLRVAHFTELGRMVIEDWDPVFCLYGRLLSTI